MNTLSAKERIDAVMTGKPTDRTPFTVVDAGAFVAKKEGMSYRQIFSQKDGGAAVIKKYFDLFHSDTINATSGVFTACLNAFGSPIYIDTPGATIDTGIALKNPELEIPELNRVEVREKLLRNEFVQWMLNQTENIKKLTGEDRYLLGDVAGPFTMAAVLVGTDKFLVMLLDDPELCIQLIDFATEISAQMLNLLHERGCDIAFISEPVASGSLISQSMFESWVVPAYNNLICKLGAYKYIFTHICGDAGKRTSSLRDLGLSAFSFDFMVDLNQALNDADHKLTLMGNMNPAGVLLTGTVKQVRDEAKEIIRRTKGFPFILAPGCDLGSDTPLENVQAMYQTCIEEGN